MNGALTDWIPELPKTWRVAPFYTVFQERIAKNEGLVENNLLSLSYGAIIRKDVDSDHGLLPASFDGYNIVEPNDIVMRLTDMQNDQRSLRTGPVRERGIITSAYVSVTPSPALLPRFAHYLLHGYDLAKVYYRMGGGLRQSMKYGDLRRLPIVVPPKLEQERIANFLDEQTERIDALIAEKERLMTALDEWSAAELTRICMGVDTAAIPTGNSWIPQLPAGWKLMRLKHLAARIEQGWSPECDAGMAAEGEWGVLKAGAANGGTYRETEHKALPAALDPIPELEVQQGDVLITRASGSAKLVGSFAYVYKTRPKLMLSDKNFRLRFASEPKLLPELLAWICNTRAVREQVLQYVSGAEGLAKNIGSGNLREIWLAVPPRSEQTGLVEQLKTSRGQLEALSAHLTAHIERLREFRSSLISAAVTGQLDINSYKEAA